MPFGIAPAPELFQNRLEVALSGLVGVKAIVDVLLVFGEGKTVEKAIEQHNTKNQQMKIVTYTNGVLINNTNLTPT